MFLCAQSSRVKRGGIEMERYLGGERVPKKKKGGRRGGEEGGKT